MKNKKLMGKDWTDTTLFLLPTFGIPKEILEGAGFINAYIYDKNKEEEYNGVPIFLLFDVEEDDKVSNLSRLEEQLEDREIVLGEYMYGVNYAVVVLKFPEQYLEDYTKFLAGRYSKFSDEYKDTLPSQVVVDMGFGNKLAGDSLQSMVFKKDNRIKKHIEQFYDISLEDSKEFWRKPDKIAETLDIDKVKKENEDRSIERKVS